MKYKKLIFLFIIIFSLKVSPADIKSYPANFSFISEKKLQIGEELTYVVSYAFISLGEVKFKIIDKSEFENKTVYRAEAFIDSYEDIPFVSIHQIYKTILNADSYSLFFEKITLDEDYNTFTEYNFDYEKNLIHVEKGYIDSKKIIADSLVNIDSFYQDGLSLFYYARINSGQKKSEVVPCFVNENKSTVEINFYNEPEDISIDALDYPVRCAKVDGSINFTGIYGLTGGFEAWFTDDEAAIPVLAEMQVIIGSISLELVEWKREGWKPPEFID